jgi:uncharacterized membrane protein YfcA
MATKALTFSAVAFMVLVAATMLASAVAMIRDEGWDWLSALWLCAAITTAVAVGAFSVLVLA